MSFTGCWARRAIPWVALGLLVGLPSMTAAQLDCQVPTRERVSTGTLSSAALAPIRKVALAVEAIVKKNAVFMAGVRPIRVRTTIDYALDQPRTAIVNVRAYNKEAWIAGRCDVIPEADRGGGVSDGAIHIVVNDPRTFFGGSLGDADLEIYEEPARTGEVAGFPEYGGMYALMSEGGRVPWIPVTIAQVLDREERRLRARQDEWAKAKERPWMSEAKIQESYELLKKINAAAADEQRAAMMAVLQEEKVRRPKIEAEGDAALAKELAELSAYRATFSALQLQGQASPGAMRPGGGVRVDDPKGRKLVTVDPAFSKLPPDRVHLIRVFRGGVAQDPVPGRYAWQRQSNDALDYAALAALLK